MQQNFCLFDGKIYVYDKGLPMGSPLSGMLADIFLNEIEDKYILNDTNPIRKNILLWKRYVDDIFIIIKDKNDNTIEDLHEYINSLHNDITFTVEVEQDNTLNFLDLTLKNTNSGLQYQIYHKVTQTDIVIPYDSHHDHTHKLAAFRSYIDRAFSSSLTPDQIQIELSIIKQIANNNSFPDKIIEDLIKKQQSKNLIQIYTSRNQQNKEQPITYRSINYQGKVCNKIKNIFKKYDILISCKTNNTIGQILNNGKDRIDIPNDNGVYKLECDTCKATYIGETGRALHTRIKEHKNKSSSNFGRHLNFNTEHQFDENIHATILHRKNKGYMLELLESYEINKFKNNNPNILCLNDQIQPVSKPLYSYLQTPYTLPSKKPPDKRGFQTMVTV
ncbi:uncharacterized protein [Onthophagus taurus]|uniref:uncharacterized protein n=1 Tax=Onthophagus taurus TaxID=166361 RepID=UPI0039BE2921